MKQKELTENQQGVIQGKVNNYGYITSCNICVVM